MDEKHPQKRESDNKGESLNDTTKTSRIKQSDTKKDLRPSKKNLSDKFNK